VRNGSDHIDGDQGEFGFPRFLRIESPPHLDAVRVVDQRLGDAVGQRGVLASRVESGGGLATTLVSVVTLRGSLS